MGHNPSKLSVTSMVVALAVLKTFYAQNPSGVLVSVEQGNLLKGWLQSLGGRIAIISYLLRIPPARIIFDGVERLLLPGFCTHVALRKRWVEEEVRRLISTGVREVVFYGAGLDTLAQSLSREFPGLRCIEVDLPAMSLLKRRLLSQVQGLLGVPSMTVDEFSWEIYEAVAQQSRLIVAEGVLMYLPEAGARELLEEWASHGISHAIVTVMNRNDRGEVNFRGASRMIRLWLRAWGEPFLWGAPQETLQSFFESAGWRVETILHTCEHPLAKDAPQHPAQGEFCLLLRRLSPAKDG